MTKKRIWELDAARGFFLIGMIGIHFVYDLVDLYGVWNVELPNWYLLFKNNYGAVFLLLSGLSATLGKRCVRRGIQVFCGGLICSAVTWGMYRFGFADRGILIYFGVLHCLGVCMILWAVLRKLPTPVLAITGLILWAVGIWLRSQVFSFPWLTILGLCPYGFVSSDFFPLMPNLGYFLLGAALGRKCYPQKVSRLPGQEALFPILQWGGRHSLLIYLLHQPILAALVAAISCI